MPGPEDSLVSAFLIHHSERVTTSIATPKHVRTLKQVVDTILVAYERSLRNQQSDEDRIMGVVSRIMYYTQRQVDPIDREVLIKALNEAGLEVRVGNPNDNLNE